MKKVKRIIGQTTSAGKAMGPSVDHGEPMETFQGDVDLLLQELEIHNIKAYCNLDTYAVFVIVEAIMTISITLSNIYFMLCNSNEYENINQNYQQAF